MLNFLTLSCKNFLEEYLTYNFRQMYILIVKILKDQERKILLIHHLELQLHLVELAALILRMM